MTSEAYDIWKDDKAVKNAEREMENDRETFCASCDGNGTHDIYHDEYDVLEIICTNCNGTGKVKEGGLL